MFNFDNQNTFTTVNHFFWENVDRLILIMKSLRKQIGLKASVALTLVCNFSHANDDDDDYYSYSYYYSYYYDYLSDVPLDFR